MPNNAGRAFGIHIKDNLFSGLEKRLKYRFWDKGRERSNRAKAMAEGGPSVPRCPRKHDTMGYSGPPDDSVRRYVCLICRADATEGAIVHMGHDFETVPDYIIHDLMDERQRIKFEKRDPIIFPVTR